MTEAAARIDEVTEAPRDNQSETQQTISPEVFERIDRITQTTELEIRAVMQRRASKMRDLALQIFLTQQSATIKRADLARAIDAENTDTSTSVAIFNIRRSLDTDGITLEMKGPQGKGKTRQQTDTQDLTLRSQRFTLTEDIPQELQAFHAHAKSVINQLENPATKELLEKLAGKYLGEEIEIDQATLDQSNTELEKHKIYIAQRRGVAILKPSFSSKIQLPTPKKLPTTAPEPEAEQVIDAEAAIVIADLRAQLAAAQQTIQDKDGIISRQAEMIDEQTTKTETTKHHLKMASRRASEAEKSIAKLNGQIRNLEKERDKLKRNLRIATSKVEIDTSFMEAIESNEELFIDNELALEILKLIAEPNEQGKLGMTSQQILEYLQEDFEGLTTHKIAAAINGSKELLARIGLQVNINRKTSGNVYTLAKLEETKEAAIVAEIESPATTELEATISNLRDQINKKQQELSATQVELAAKEQALEKSQSQVKDLESQLASAKGRIETLESELRAAEELMEVATSSSAAPIQKTTEPAPAPAAPAPSPAPAAKSAEKPQSATDWVNTIRNFKSNSGADLANAVKSAVILFAAKNGSSIPKGDIRNIRNALTKGADPQRGSYAHDLRPKIVQSLQSLNEANGSEAAVNTFLAEVDKALRDL